MRRKFLNALVMVVMMTTLGSCAAGPNERVYHAFELRVDQSIEYAKHIRYRYGELGEQEKPSAKFGASFTTMRLEMPIPEDFEISWETPDGKGHHAVVPVRSRLQGSVTGKNILFLILYDEVQGYVATNTPTGEKRERFY